MIIGITGFIGSGKSSIAEYMAKKLHFTIFNADMIVHDLYERLEVINHVKNICNNAVINNKIDRNILRKYFLCNKEVEINIQKIVSDLLQKEFKKYQLKYTNLILDIPLLFERDWHKKCNLTIISVISYENIIKRVQNRNKNLSKKDIDAILNRQMPQNEKIKLADFIIYNDDDFNVLYKNTDLILDIISNYL